MSTLNIDVRLNYHFKSPTDVLFQLEAASMKEQNILSSHIAIRDLNGMNPLYRLAGASDIGERFWVQLYGDMQLNYSAEILVNRMNQPIDQLMQVQTRYLDGETLIYLMGSRFCPSDEFQNFVSSQFGALQGGALVMKMVQWIGNKITYVRGSSNAQTTAMNTYVQRQGVCRDFAHLLITFARASCIPARMVSAYGLNVYPQDFHALVEVFLDGGWHLVDATGMTKPDEIAIIGVGRDAADISFLTSYGTAQLQMQDVSVTAG